MELSHSGLEIRLLSVIERINVAAKKSGREGKDITLVAVSKTHTAEKMNEFSLIARSISVPVIFGESYVQEFKAKKQQLVGADSFHLIGPLQSNKIRDAVSLFDVIESVQSLKVLDLLSKEAVRVGKKQKVLIQVNISKDESKSGFLAEEFLTDESLSGPRDSLEIIGLMTVTTLYSEPEESRADFRKLFELRNGLLEKRPEVFTPGHFELSMGMSSDFDIAIEEGATIVRVGSALFGER